MTVDPRAGRPPTIRDVAALAGVSKSLVSLVLQNSPRVSEPKRRAVISAMAELGYRPDPAARSLAERRTRTVGLVVDDLLNPWYGALLDGLRPVLHEHGLRPLLADGRTEPDAVRALVDLRVDGLVLAGTPTRSAIAQVRELSSAQPVVLAGTREPQVSGVDVVANDDIAGACLVTEYLLALGHRRIVHIVGEGEVGRLRRTAFAGAMAGAGLAAPAVDGDWTEVTGRRIADVLLGQDDRPTAVFAANDLSAVGVLAAADQLGLRVPDDLSVVGYDNTVFARLDRLSLTSVDGHIAEVGRVAGQVLIDRLGGGTGTVTTRLLAPTLVRRSSTGPPGPGS